MALIINNKGQIKKALREKVRKREAWPGVTTALRRLKRLSELFCIAIYFVPGV